MPLYDPDDIVEEELTDEQLDRRARLKRAYDDGYQAAFHAGDPEPPYYEDLSCDAEFQHGYEDGKLEAKYQHLYEIGETPPHRTIELPRLADLPELPEKKFPRRKPTQEELEIQQTHEAKLRFLKQLR